MPARAFTLARTARQAGMRKAVRPRERDLAGAGYVDRAAQSALELGQEMLDLRKSTPTTRYMSCGGHSERKPHFASSVRLGRHTSSKASCGGSRFIPAALSGRTARSP